MPNKNNRRFLWAICSSSPIEVSKGVVARSREDAEAAPSRALVIFVFSHFSALVEVCNSDFSSGWLSHRS